MPEGIKHFFKFFCTGLAAGLCILAVFSASAYLLRLHQSSKQAEALKERLKTAAVQPAASDAGHLPVIDWQALEASCPDAVGWLWCPETTLDYPIVQGADNDYYLTHMADQTPDHHGAVFLDCRASPQFADRHTLLYGHNMTDGSMFHDLLNWQDAEYLARHPCIYILTPVASYEMRVFSAYETLPDSDSYRTAFSGSDFVAWQDALCRRSVFPVPGGGVTAERVVTLSTCTDSAHRFVLHGALSLYHIQ